MAQPKVNPYLLIGDHVYYSCETLEEAISIGKNASKQNKDTLEIFQLIGYIIPPDIHPTYHSVEDIERNRIS